MAIQEISIQGYRSFQDVTWRPGKLNLLVGPNGSGKSNFLRFLGLISNIAKGRLATAINESDGIYSLLWNHEADHLGWKIRLDPVDQGRDAIQDALTLEMEITQIGSGVRVYEITKDNLGNWYKVDQGFEKSPYWIFKRDTKRVYVFKQPNAGLENIDDSDLFENFEENESLLCQVDSRTNEIPPLVRRELESWGIYHDLHVETGSAMRMPSVTQYETRVESDGRNLATVLHTLYSGNRDFKKEIDEGMQAAFGDEYEEIKIRPVAKNLIELAIQWKSSSDPHSGQELSDGTLRYLLLLTVLASPEPPPVITLDEPEVGLNPSMLPLIADFAAAASERTQVFITTHSPEFLDAFSDQEPSVSVFHWEDGASHIYPLDSNSLSRWLEQYRLGEMFTSGDLTALSHPDLEPLPDLEEKLNQLPSEDAAVSD